MSDYTVLAVLTACLFIGGPVASAVTREVLGQLRLRRVRRAGYVMTVGITGRPEDLQAQKRELARQHSAVRRLGTTDDLDNVLPFPARQKRGA